MLVQTAAFFSLASFAVASTVTTPPAPGITAAPELVKRSSGDGNTPLPLTEYQFPYSAIPYKVNPYQYLRGPQSGYNICNSTTEGPDSQCQTLIMNDVSDFCLYGSPGTSPNDTIGDIEAAVVTYCTRSGHGARIMPAGTITGVQFMRTSAYIQITGTFNQAGINLSPDDTGGELDPHGADLLGNPLGGLVYSTGLLGANGTGYTQADNWNLFVGGNIFCLKLCFNTVTSPDYCQNKFDLIGCAYNMPAAYATNVYESCEGDLQDEVGTYTSNGQTLTWSQPSLLPATSTLPWTPRIPASSNCVTYQSSDIFPIASLGYQNTASVSATSSAATSQATSGSGANTASPASTGGSTRATSSSASATSSRTSGSSVNQASALLLAIAAALMFL